MLQFLIIWDLIIFDWVYIWLRLSWFVLLSFSSIILFNLIEYRTSASQVALNSNETWCGVVAVEWGFYLLIIIPLERCRKKMNQKWFKEPRTNTRRYQRPALPYMTKLLNHNQESKRQNCIQIYRCMPRRMIISLLIWVLKLYEICVIIRLIVMLVMKIVIISNIICPVRT